MEEHNDPNSRVVIKEVTPEFHSERCPVCNGFGTLKYGTLTCQGCGGKGYIVVPNFKLEGGSDYGHKQNR